MLQITLTDDAVAALDRGRFSDPDPRVRRKLQVVWLKSHGLAHRQIAALAGVSSRTVQRYLNTYLDGGIEALRQNGYRGQPSQLNAHGSKVKASLEQHPPSTIHEASHQITQLTGLRRGPTQVRAFLKRLGLRRRKLGGVPGKLDQAKHQQQREFLEQTLDPALDEAERGDRRVFL